MEIAKETREVEMTASNKVDMLEEVLAYADAENRWVRLYFDKVRFPNGKQGRFNRIVEGAANAGVAILPYTKSQIGLVRQFRYPVSEEVWEIPRGFADTSDLEANARRELVEETNLQPASLRNLGQVHPNSGLLSAKVYIFAAHFESPEHSRPNDLDEVSEFRWFPCHKVIEDAAGGAIKDVFTIAALFRAMHLGLLKGS
jgi:ADP-ribose pyrophosphatase